MLRSLTSLTCLLLLNLVRSQWFDPTFGSDGLVAISLNAGYDGAFSTVVQPDGKIVVAGSIAGNGGYDFLVARYLSDGTLDTDFGTGGSATHHERAQDFGRDVALQADGGIVVVGTSSGGGTDKVVLRFTEAGVLDPSFGAGGVVIIDDSAVDDALWGVAIQPDQHIVIVGQGSDGTLRTFYTARLRSDGSFDPEFADAGELEHLIGTDYCWAQDVTLLPDGRIVVAGNSYTTGVSAHDAAVVRYLPDGSFDTSFGVGGKVVIPWSEQSDGAYAIAAYGDGRVVVAGSSALTATRIVASRLLVDGSLDPDFGANGTVLTYAGAAPSRCGGVAIDAYERVLLAGTATEDNTHRNSYLCRLLPSGDPDPSFGINGELIHGAPAVFEETPAIALQQDGKIILAGITGAGTNINVRLIRYSGGSPTNVRTIADDALHVIHMDGSGLDLMIPCEPMMQYRIISATGVSVQQGRLNTIGNSVARIDFSNQLASGAYILTVHSSERRLITRFVVARQ